MIVENLRRFHTKYDGKGTVYLVDEIFARFGYLPLCSACLTNSASLFYCCHAIHVSGGAESFQQQKTSLFRRSLKAIAKKSVISYEAPFASVESRYFFRCCHGNQLSDAIYDSNYNATSKTREDYNGWVTAVDSYGVTL